MPIDTSSLLAIALLVFAASVAAFLLSQWSRLLATRTALTQWACGIAVVALLAAATVYFLSVISPTRLVAIDDDPRTSGTSRIGGFPEQRSRGTPEVVSPPIREDSERSSASSVDARPVRPFSEPTNSRGDAAVQSRTAKTNSLEQREHQTSRTADRARSLSSSPWAATECVFQIQPDPAQSDLWWLENECDVPVGIVVATCSGSQADCAEPRSTSWSYAERGMYLPSKQQRSVTYAEQTLRGNQIRFIACVITSQIAIELLASDNGAASRRWREALSTSISYDACISEVLRLSEAGKRARTSMEDVAGANVPGRARQIRQ